MSKILFGVPFLYSILFIMAPMQFLDLNYWESMVVFFWIPIAILLSINSKWMSEHSLWTSFLLTCMALNIASIAVETMSLYWGIWHFDTTNPAHSLLYTGELGKKLLFLTYPFGAPVEEFMFYFGATPFCLLVYISYFRLIKKDYEKDRVRGDLYSFLAHFAWAIVGMPFIPFLKYMMSKMKDSKVVSWGAVAFATAVFYGTMTFVEIYSLKNHHWVYDYSKVLLPLFKYKVPIEEYLLYYLLGPIFVIFLFHFLELRPRIEFGKSSFRKVIP
jgi:hypothetical protein